MKFYSTNNPNFQVDLRKAVLQSLAPDKGLYMPTHIDRFSSQWIEDTLPNLDLVEIAFEVSSKLFGPTIPAGELRSLIEKSINFEAPKERLAENLYSLELWHGPSMAFKDFGARFMAALMGYFLQNDDQKTTILVATSGDTGGAVAAGFYGHPFIDVVILYPSGKVSDIQEKQLTTLGQNIRAYEVAGSFDDCQDLVKKAFLDTDLCRKFQLSSANSINIARLIPQSFYYFDSAKEFVRHKDRSLVYSVPSGNFGNLTAGLIAKKMGLPIDLFLATTNANDTVPHFLSTGSFVPKVSVQTISNAMDVGNPSNFVRMMELYGHDVHAMRSDLRGYAYTDTENEEAIRRVFDVFGYVTDPHGALAAWSLIQYQLENPQAIGVFLETAHPAKFLDVMNPILGEDVVIPDRLAILAQKVKQATKIGTDFENFKLQLMGDLKIH